MIKVAINGYGRIGRNILRALYENDYRDKIQIVAVNDLADPAINTHLTKYDSVHGKFSAEVDFKSMDNKNIMMVNDDLINVYQQRDPAQLPWKDLDIDIVYECTGFFRSRDAASLHLTAGAKKVIISAPGTDVDATIVFGVNDHILNAESTIISNASCTTNCLAPLAQLMHESVGIEKGNMTTVHSYTNDQTLIDVAHSDIYRARSATQSMIPTKTGAAAAVGLVLPELAGKLDGMSIRVPTINVSLVDFHFVAKRDTSVAEINEVVATAAAGKMKPILEYVEAPLVSIDFNHNPASSCFAPSQTRVNGNLVKIMSWYDNEWGFSNRMLDTSLVLMKR